MRKCLLMTSLLLLVALPARGQDVPRVDVFGGGSYARLDVTNIRHIDMKGWHTSVDENVNKWFGAVADFSGHYRTTSSLLFAGGTDRTAVYSFLFGPRFSFRKFERVTPFAQAMLGAAHMSISPQVSRVLLPKVSGNALAAGFGGGLDVQVHRGIAVRVFQADYVVTRFREIARNVATGEIGFLGRPRPQNNLRISAGIVLRFGSSKR